jgi:predicted esterase YcpF (UPF0227 family)
MERRANDERLAVVETQVLTLKEDCEEIMKKLDCLLAEMHKARGFWAGVVAAGTALGGILGFLISYIFKIKTG